MGITTTHDEQDLGRDYGDEIRRPKRRYNIHDVEKENSPHVFIRHVSAREIGEAAHLLIPYTSSQSGDRKSIEVPMTSIPIDLAESVSKDELLQNTVLRSLHADGYIDFVPFEDALRELDRPESIQEMDRLMFQKKERIRRRPSNAQSNDLQKTPDGVFQVAGSADQVLQQNLDQIRGQQNAPVIGLQPGGETAAKGEYAAQGAGVNAAVVQIMEDNTVSVQHRLAFLRNYDEMKLLTETDKKYVRGMTDNAEIRKLVG